MVLWVPDARPEDVVVSARLVASGARANQPDPAQAFVVQPQHVVLEALIDRDSFPRDYDVEALTNKGKFRVNCGDLVEAERQEYARASMAPLLTSLEDWRSKNPGRSPRVLDIGGRARSGVLSSKQLQGCDVTVLDIVADTGVDVVADIHEMTDAVGEDAYDYVVCVSVFEHLAMPWKAVLEINKVLKPGGVTLIQTHQTIGMHDLPWDFFRFSDESWKALFNEATGFEIVSTAMNDFVRIVPTHYYNVFKGYEGAGGFYDSFVFARKIGVSKLDWPVELKSIVSTMYPA